MTNQWISEIFLTRLRPLLRTTNRRKNNNGTTDWCAATEFYL